MRSRRDLYAIADRLLGKGRGILAADESARTMGKRLEAVGVLPSDEMGRVYRELLFTAPHIEEYLSGVILYDATIRGATQSGVPFPDLLISRGIIPGIKVDLGTVELSGFKDEVVTEGLDGLAGRLEAYHDFGARFAKWRAVYTIGEHIPSDQCIAINSILLARYAALVQEAGMVPMVEPEVIMHGKHNLARAEEVTMRVLQILFATLREYRVDLKGVILKSSMVLAGDGHKEETRPDEVADATLRAFHLSVPHEVPGIVFLSGGQTPVRATKNLEAIAERGEQPWKLTFSYSRAIEEPVLAAWKGDQKNVAKAQAALLHRSKMNGLAQMGEYSDDMEKE